MLIVLSSNYRPSIVFSKPSLVSNFPYWFKKFTSNNIFKLSLIESRNYFSNGLAVSYSLVAVLVIWQYRQYPSGRILMLLKLALKRKWIRENDMATIIRMMYLPSRSSFSLSFEAFAFPLKVTRLLHFTVSLTNCPLRYFIQPTNLP